MRRAKRPENYGNIISAIGASIEDGALVAYIDNDAQITLTTDQKVHSHQVPAMLSSAEYAQLSVIGWWHDGVKYTL